MLSCSRNGRLGSMVEFIRLRELGSTENINSRIRRYLFSIFLFLLCFYACGSLFLWTPYDSILLKKKASSVWDRSAHTDNGVCLIHKYLVLNDLLVEISCSSPSWRTINNHCSSTDSFTCTQMYVKHDLSPFIAPSMLSLTWISIQRTSFWKCMIRPPIQAFVSVHLMNWTLFSCGIIQLDVAKLWLTALNVLEKLEPIFEAKLWNTIRWRRNCPAKSIELGCRQ